MKTMIIVGGWRWPGTELRSANFAAQELDGYHVGPALHEAHEGTSTRELDDGS